MSVYSAEIWVYGNNYPAPGLLHHGHHLVRADDDTGRHSPDRNEACRKAENLASFLCKKLHGSKAAFYVPDHWNQNTKTGFTK